MKKHSVVMMSHARMWALVLVGTSLLLSGCGRDTEPALYDDVDISRMGDPFAAPATGLFEMDTDRVVARVDGKELTQGELAREINMIVGQLHGRVPPERISQMQDEIVHQAMESLIIKSLLSDRVEKEQVAVDPADVDDAIERLVATIPPGSSLEQQLGEMGLTKEDFRARVEHDLRISKILEQKVGDLAEPTDEEVEDFYNQNIQHFARPETASARHILISVSPETDDAEREEQRAQAEAIRERLLAGEDFADLAAEFSDCPSGARGGDLGEFTRGQMVPPFEEAAFTQPLNEIGPIVETRFGYHIIKVNDRTEPHTLTLDESRERIAQVLLGEQQRTALQRYISALRDEADIEFMEMP